MIERVIAEYRTAITIVLGLVSTSVVVLLVARAGRRRKR